jgi:uncharacterized membrane protein YeaQ/YmgE (transglycosylase-associated protein family)
MTIFGILWAVITGFIIGLIARALMPGVDTMGFFATSAVGIVGSLIGGFIGSMVSRPPDGIKFHPAGFFLSVIGAIVLLLVLRQIH